VAYLLSAIDLIGSRFDRSLAAYTVVAVRNFKTAQTRGGWFL